MEKKYLLSLITKYSNIQLSIIDSNSFSIHSTSTFTDNIFKLFDESRKWNYSDKGKLPVIPFLERVKIVESIKYVDMVVPQTNKNKQEAIDKYNIDAISVGDDWKGRYPKTSCPVEYFTYTPNVSSTILKGLLSNSKI